MAEAAAAKNNNNNNSTEKNENELKVMMRVDPGCVCVPEREMLRLGNRNAIGTKCDHKNQEHTPVLRPARTGGGGELGYETSGNGILSVGYFVAPLVCVLLLFFFFAALFNFRDVGFYCGLHLLRVPNMFLL